MNALPEPLTEETWGRPVFRTLPHNIEAEKSLIGAIFANNKAYEKVSEFLLPEHFVIAQHGIIYGEIARIINQGGLADPVTLAPLFEGEGMSEIGGVGYAIDLAESVVSIINAGEYGRIIYDTHLKRELIALGEDVVNRAYANDIEDGATSQIEAVEQALNKLSTPGGAKDLSPVDQMDSTLKGIEATYKGEQPPGVKTGIADLDRILGCIRDQNLCILAGRPGMGKSILGMKIAEVLADGGGIKDTALYFSLEMSAEELNERRIANRTAISIGSIRTPRGLGQPEMEKVVLTGQELAKKPLIIDDTPALTISDVRRRARRQARKGLGLIVVDHIGLMRPEDPKQMKVYQVEAITNGLKALAKELDVPIIALSQLSRAVEQRDVKRPSLSDLRDSGSVEQDADIVLLLYREWYYLDRDKPEQKENETDEKFFTSCTRYKDRLAASENKVEIIVAKQRQGPTGTVIANFDGSRMRIADAVREELF